MKKLKPRYEDYKKLIYQKAWQYHQKTGIEFDELVGVANLAYAKALNKFDPDRGKFSTLLWHSIVNAFKSYMKNHFRYEQTRCLFEDLKDEEHQGQESFIESDMKFVTIQDRMGNLILETNRKRLSKNAKRCLKFFFHEIEKPKTHHKRDFLKKLKERGILKEEQNLCFDEIQSIIQ